MPNILDTFYILFKSNAEEVTKGEEAATQAGKKLETTLNEVGKEGEAAGKKIEEGNNRLAESFDKVKEHVSEWGKHCVEQAFEVAAAFTALFEVEKLVDSVFETAEQSDQLGERAKSLGVKVEDLDAWGNAAKRVGGSADAFGESLINVNRQLSRMEATGKSRILPFFKELGLGAADMKKPLMELLPLLAGATEGKDKQTTAGALRGIGFDEGTIRLLQRGNKEVNELIERQRQLGLITAEDAETAEKFNIEWDDIKQIFHSLVVAFDTEVLPMLQQFLEGVEAIIEYLKAHKNLAIGFFIALGGAVLYAAEAFGVLGAVVDFFLSPLFLVIGAVTALVAAFAFLYDDLMTFSKGGKSVIGELAKLHPIVGTIAHAIISLFADIKDGVKSAVVSVVNWVRQIPEGMRQWQEIFDWAATAFRALWQHMMATLEEYVPGVGTVFAKVAVVVEDAIKLIGKAVSLGFRFVVDSAWFLIKELGAIFGLLADLVVNPEHAFQNFAKRMKKIIDDVSKDFPQLTKAFEDVQHAWETIATAIINLWHNVENVIGETIGRIEGWLAKTKVGGLIKFAVQKVENVANSSLVNSAEKLAGDGGLSSDAPKHTAADVSSLGAYYSALSGGTFPAAASALAAAGSPLGAVPGTAIVGAATPSNTTYNDNKVTVQGSTINATSSSPQDIATAVDQHLARHVDDALNHLASGQSH